MTATPSHRADGRSARADATTEEATDEGTPVGEASWPAGKARPAAHRTPTFETLRDANQLWTAEELELFTPQTRAEAKALVEAKATAELLARARAYAEVRSQAQAQGKRTTKPPTKPGSKPPTGPGDGDPPAPTNRADPTDRADQSDRADRGGQADPTEPPLGSRHARRDAPAQASSRHTSVRTSGPGRHAIPPVPTPGVTETRAIGTATTLGATRATRRAADITTAAPAPLDSEGARQASARHAADGSRGRHGAARRHPLSTLAAIVGAITAAGVLTAAQATGAPARSTLAAGAEPPSGAPAAVAAPGELLTQTSRSSVRTTRISPVTQAAEAAQAADAAETRADRVEVAREASVAKVAEAEQAAVAAAAEARRFIHPIDSQINSGFGYRVDPFGGGSSFHPGIDFSAGCGVDVHAAADGTVVESGWTSGYGWRVVVEHGVRDGHVIRSTYNHLSVRDVEVGAVVTKGQLVGQVGTTGSSTGCHLHFEVLVDGTPVDPMPYF